MSQPPQPARLRFILTRESWMRHRVDQLRALPLESVLRLSHAQPDRQDPHKWHTPRGTLSIKGAKFMNWTEGTGGGGAIDLVMHLHRQGFTDALHWLDRHLSNSLSVPTPGPPCQGTLHLPQLQPYHLARVRAYLIKERALPAHLIDRLIQCANLYADQRANAVFLLLGKANQAVGAELRGTGPITWRGMAPGSRKDRGFFSVPVVPSASSAAPAAIILCESAIDAISCFALHPDHRALSTSGARPNPRWLADLLASNSNLYCGFDADPTGDAMAQAMIAQHPRIQRLRPPRHDWNDTLRSLR